ncbi:MAG: glycoside hydrolase [Verrucomicrobiota bacterium]
MDLNGVWECGHERRYDRTANVPGLIDDPRKSSPATVWLKRSIQRPDKARYATLVLKGARFAPEVYVDGRRQSSTEGGMAPTRHMLDLNETDTTFALEIALQPLDRLDTQDASRIPGADAWRSNLSSCVWDDVELFFRGPAYIERLYTYTANDGALRVHVVTGGTGESAELQFSLRDDNGSEILRHSASVEIGKSLDIELPGGSELPEWSPETPRCFTLTAELHADGQCSHSDVVTVARRRFEVRDKRFALNGHDVTLRAGSIVWHRWLRDPEAPPLAWDMNWLTENVLMRLKRMGANTLRFHLGMPPDRLLDACDRLGLLVQAEWLFFHGCDASRDSMAKQWSDWFELCFRHPSVCLIHPWNETDPQALTAAWAAIDAVTAQYPPVVLSHRDVQHPHRYWWSLFENVGLYYDNAEVFEQPIMVDEFGGNYLDGEGRPGGYPKLREAFARFLGRNHTAPERLQLQADACGRMAEYWRRIGAAGFSPFCILGPPEDGNHHFLGPLRAGRPKPVWNALSAAYAPVAASLDTWERNFRPGESIELPLHLLNDTPHAVDAELTCSVTGGDETVEQVSLPAHAHHILHRRFELPRSEGECTLEARLDHAGRQPAAPARSRWRVWTLAPKPASGCRAAALPDEDEIDAFLDSADIRDDAADTLVGGAHTYRRLLRDTQDGQELEDLLRQGRTIILLEAGPPYFGAGYTGTAQTNQVRATDDIDPTQDRLPGGAMVCWSPLAEPESAIHPATGAEDLWTGLRKENTALWAGLKGGIIAPAVDMRFEGFSAAAVLAHWTARGANDEAIRKGPCFACEKAGYIEFAPEPSEAVKRRLEERISFLIDDAPALADRIDPRGPVAVHDLHQLWSEADGAIRALRPLIVCGKGLTRTAAVDIVFEHLPGRLILTQLLTGGRLATPPQADGRRPDPGAAQLVLNLIRNNPPSR